MLSHELPQRADYDACDGWGVVDQPAILQTEARRSNQAMPK